MRYRRRTWTAEEDACLRGVHGAMTAAEIGRALLRARRSVYQRLALKGLTRRRASFGSDFEAFLTQKHAEGWSDAEIATAWGCWRRTSGRRCQSLQGVLEQMGVTPGSYNAEWELRQRAEGWQSRVPRRVIERMERLVGDLDLLKREFQDEHRAAGAG